MSTMPVDVIKSQSAHLNRSQPEPYEQQQNREVAPAFLRVAVALIQQQLYLCRLKRHRQTCVPPVADHGYANEDILIKFPAHVQEAEQGSQS